MAENADDILKELNLKKKGFSFSTKITGETNEENLILKNLKNESLDIDRLIQKTALSASQVASALANLEIKGKVKSLGGNIYAVNHR